MAQFATSGYSEAAKNAYDTYNTNLAKRKTDYDTGKETYGYDERVRNLDSIRKNVADTDRMLKTLPTDVARRTLGRPTGGPVTSSVLNRIIASERNPLASTLADLTSSEGVENQGLSMVTGILNDIWNRGGESAKDVYGADMGNADTLYKSWQANDASERANADEAFRQKQLALQQQMSTFNYDPLTSLLDSLKKQANITLPKSGLSGIMAGVKGLGAGSITSSKAALDKQLQAGQLSIKDYTAKLKNLALGK